jgi:8-oxo-dGTP diphosphatase
MAFTYQHPHPAVTTDCVVLGYLQPELKVLLVQRKNAPFQDHWALPGGFVEIDEPLDRAALRELQEETGLDDLYYEQLYTFGEPNRDPRERVISVSYLALVPLAGTRVQAGSDAADARWFSLLDLPELAFDHHTILNTGLKRLRGKIRYAPVAFELLPEKFTLSQLQTLYEVILQEKLDKRNFRKKITGLKLLQPLEELEQGVPHRAARLYRFDRTADPRRETGSPGFWI